MKIINEQNFNINNDLFIFLNKNFYIECAQLKFKKLYFKKKYKIWNIFNVLHFNNIININITCENAYIIVKLIYSLFRSIL